LLNNNEMNPATCLNIATIPLAVHMYICYKTFVEPIWLTKYWALVLIAHTFLTLLTIVLWCFAEYRILWDSKAQERSVYYKPRVLNPSDTDREMRRFIPIPLPRETHYEDQ